MPWSHKIVFKEISVDKSSTTQTMRVFTVSFYRARFCRHLKVSNSNNNSNINNNNIKINNIKINMKNNSSNIKRAIQKKKVNTYMDDTFSRDTRV